MPDDSSKLEQLYRELGPSLLGYFRHRAGGSAAEDLLQETFLRAARHPERMAQAVSSRAYLFGIARHVLVDELRRTPPPGEPAETAAPAEAGDDRLELVHGAIGGLPERLREALLLKLRQELSYEEIAHVLGVPVGTVRSRLHHAVARLKQILNPSEPPPLSAQLRPDAHET